MLTINKIKRWTMSCRSNGRVGSASLRESIAGPSSFRRRRRSAFECIAESVLCASGMRAPFVLWSDRNGRGVTNAGRSRARFSSVFFRVATPVLLFLAAIGVRMLAWHSVFQQSGVYPNGNDAYYHLQRIRYSVEHFPEILRFDPLMNFPAGAQSIWPPTFDWLIAALLRVLPGIDQPGQLDRYAVCIPPIIGVLTVLLVYRLGLRFFSRTVGVVAALSMAILPAHSLYSRVGAVDHHALVATIVAIMLGLAMGLVRNERDGGDGGGGIGGGIGDGETRGVTRRRIGLSIALGLSMAVAVLIWPGSLLQVGVLQAALVVLLLSTKDLVAAKRWATCFAIVHFVAFLAVAPMSIGNSWQLWGPFSPVVLSNFQPVYFLAGALCFGLLGGIWRLG
jgi:asparagine N-glycosylation enzyme membrane subunit Stt3